MVNTATVAGFRTLKFDGFESMWREVEKVAAADAAGRLKPIGNWTAGQAFGHLATWIEYPYDGYPPDLKPPLWIKLLLRMMKKKFLYGTMKRGVRIPGVQGGTKGTEPMTTEAGKARLRRAWDRLNAAPPTIPNPIFGVMTHEEWKQGHLRHAELHLGYLIPG